MSRQRKGNQPWARRPRAIWIVGPLLLGVAVILVFRPGWRGAEPGARQQAGVAPLAKPTDATVIATYGKSPSCKSCHEEEFRRWETSHHALAERRISPPLDAAAFEPPGKIRHGSQVSETKLQADKFQIVTAGLDGEQRAFAAERVIGVDPLRQFLIPTPGGRLQSTELAFDPKAGDWFDVYGEEDRKPGEWGHWTGRGMTWNVMCAACHNTRLRKNYQENGDSYATTMAEVGVGCEACHGPMAAHYEYQLKKLNEGKGEASGTQSALTLHPSPNPIWRGESSRATADPTVKRVTREEMFSVCGSCHSRRAELTGDFHPGEKFSDHYALTIPDETDFFYPDGQIREEDYEFTSFLSSRMHAAGVRCIDCHEPHSSKTRVPGNDLCMVCHAGPVPPAPKIDPATHSHHKPGERGSNCVDCHMPQTVYMQRHSRHDHGFTIPDPMLTKQFSIPNACGRCHADKGVDWQLDAVQKWYGERMERPTRARAQVIARARAGDKAAPGELVALLSSETNSFWRAVAAGLLRRWNAEPRVTAALLSSAGDPDPLVRAMSVRSLGVLAQSGSQPIQMALSSRLNDAVRAVRIDAAWALHGNVDTNSTAGLNLLAYLRHNADQPSGALQLGVFHLDRGDLSGAMNYFQRAVKWDTNSAPPHQALAVGLSLQGRKEEAVQELQAACRAAPQDAESRFKLALALNEAGQLQAAREALEAAVKLDPQFAQAWYNLGLACNALGRTEAALQNLARAETIDPNSPQIPYARATILARLGRVEAARAAALRALEIQPGYRDAAELLQSLPR